jgi:protein subunit release factor A
MSVNKFVDDLFKTIDDLKIDYNDIKHIVKENIDAEMIEQLKEEYYNFIEKEIKNSKLEELLKILGII